VAASVRQLQERAMVAELPRPIMTLTETVSVQVTVQVTIGNR
jgi:hypothetical protein